MHASTRLRLKLFISAGQSFRASCAHACLPGSLAAWAPPVPATAANTAAVPIQRKNRLVAIIHVVLCSVIGASGHSLSRRSAIVASSALLT